MCVYVYEGVGCMWSLYVYGLFCLSLCIFAYSPKVGAMFSRETRSSVSVLPFSYFDVNKSPGIYTPVPQVNLRIQVSALSV